MFSSWEPRRPVAVVLTSSLASIACTSVEAKVADPSDLACPYLLAEHTEISTTPEYSKLLPIQRSNYEVKVAACYLEEREATHALDLALGAEPGIERNMVLARAQAALNDVSGCRATLETIARVGGSAHYFADSPEFNHVAQSDWFPRLALQAWQREDWEDLDDYVVQILRKGGHRPLPLRVAAADSARQPGEWVMWNAVVRDVRLLHEQSTTMVVAEGIEIKTTQIMRDRKVDKVEHGWGSSRAVYSVEDRFAEEFVPIGKQFLVKLGHLDEDLASMNHIFVLGKYAGREGDWPVVTPISIVERKPQSKSVVKENQQ
jgi:hypothetical protein